MRSLLELFLVTMVVGSLIFAAGSLIQTVRRAQYGAEQVRRLQIMIKSDHAFRTHQEFDSRVQSHLGAWARMPK